MLCPDEQVRHAIERVFVLWRRLGSARQVVIELIAEGQQLPRRTVGQRRIRWARAELWRRARLPDQPGLCGRVRVRPHSAARSASTSTGACASRDVEVPMEQWSVCLPEHHPGYVSWPEYLQTRERLRANVRPRGEGGGAAREGAALLQGLVRCGRCGRRMQVAYSGTGGKRPPLCVRARPRPACHRARPASRSAAAASTRPSPPRSWRPSPRPASPRPPARSASWRTSTTQRLAGQRLARRARRVRGRPRAPPVRRLRARAPPRRAHPRTRARGRARRRRARARQARRARAGPPGAADRRRARARSRASRATCRGSGTPPTTTDRDRKELLRTLIREVVVTVHAAERARRRRDLLGGRRAHRAAACGSTRAAPSAAACPRTRSS